VYTSFSKLVIYDDLLCFLQTVDAAVTTAVPSTSGSDHSDCVTETMVTVPAECVAAARSASDVQSTSSATTVPGVIPSTSDCDTYLQQTTSAVDAVFVSDTAVPVTDTTVTLPSERAVATAPASDVQSSEYVIELPIVPADSQLEYFISLPDNSSTSAVPVVECVVDGRPTAQNSLRNVVLPEEIRPYPVGDRVHSTAVKRKAKSATLITGSPFKAELMNKGVSKRKSKSSSKLQPKTTKRQKMNPKLKVKPSTKSRKVENYECGSCGYNYGEPNDPLIDDYWLLCIKCAKWCHCSCGTSKKAVFTCYKCQ